MHVAELDGALHVDERSATRARWIQLGLSLQDVKQLVRPFCCGLGIGRRGSFSQRLSDRIDLMIEGHLVRNIPKDLVIPGLDDKSDGGGGLFGNDNEEFEILSAGSLAKSTSTKPGANQPQQQP